MLPLILKRVKITQIPAVLMASITLTALLLGVRQLGWLQPLELAAYDYQVSRLPDQGSDPRLLIVGITETDIRHLKSYPISDRIIAQVLANLQAYQPQVIGLDIVRDIPNEPGHAELIKQLEKPNLIGISYFDRNPESRIAPPPTIPQERIGFINIISDWDHIVRRNLMYSKDEKGQVIESFSLKLALNYLDKKGIFPRISAENRQYIELDKTIFVRITPNSGIYHRADAGGYQILLNYRSRNVARKVSLTQVLQDKIQPEWVRDKIVLIGYTASSLRDAFSTPYGEMYGVELQAQNVSQILSMVLDKKPLLWYWSETGECLWIIAWAIAGGILVWRIDNPLIQGLGTIATIMVLFSCCFFLLNLGGWVPVVAPILGVILQSGTAIIYRLQQKQEQKIAMKLLGQQTSEEIAKYLWQERSHLLEDGILPGKTLNATMFFTDIKNFSAISENISSQILMNWLNEYLKSMTSLVIEYHGIVNKFMGDGLMVVFGVPIERTTSEAIALDAKRAVNCALAMREKLQQLNQNWQSRGLPVISIRVGIFTGSVTAGSLGGTERLEYGVIGDSVNIASRLESCAKDRQIDDCRILIAKETYVYIKEDFEVEFWGPMSLKGKEQTIDVYRVIRAK